MEAETLVALNKVAGFELTVDGVDENEHNIGATRLANGTVMVQVGCQNHSADDWLENGEELIREALRDDPSNVVEEAQSMLENAGDELVEALEETNEEKYKNKAAALLSRLREGRQGTRIKRLHSNICALATFAKAVMCDEEEKPRRRTRR